MKGIKKIVIIYSCIISTTALAQNEAQEKSRKFNDAETYIQSEDFSSALPLYLELSVLDTSNSNFAYKTGLCYLKMGDKKKALSFLEKATRNVSKKYVEFSLNQTAAPEIVYYYYASALHFDYQFDQAIAMFDRFKLVTGDSKQIKQANREIEMCKYGKVAVQSPVRVIVTNLGSNVNTKFPEFASVLSADENTLIFTSRREGSTGGKTTRDGQFLEDIYLSIRNGDSWSQAEQLIGVNTERNDACVGLSADGQHLFIYKDDRGDGNIYDSKLNGSVWSTPEKLGGDINSKYWEPSATLTSDGNTLYFVSNRPGGYGGRDIYKCVKNANGMWGPAMNLGRDINTAFDEDGPFISMNGKSLYFSSNGHKSMGGFDVFCSKFDDKTKRWMSPENIGYPISTTDDDIFFVSTPDEKAAYFTSNKVGGYGEKDLYKAVFPDKPAVPIAIIKGTIQLPVDSMKALESNKILVTNLSVESDTAGEYHANSATGKYIFALNPGNVYNTSYQVKGKEMYSETIEVPKSNGVQLTEQKITFTPYPKDSVKTGYQPPVVEKKKYMAADLSAIDEILTNEMKKELKTRKVTYTTRFPLWGVQVGAFAKNVPDNNFPGLKNVHSFVDNENMIRYVVGNAASKDHAEAVRKAIVNAGYKDAFVVDINKEKKFSNEVLQEHISHTGNVEYKVQLGVFKFEIPEDLAKKYLEIEGIKEIHMDDLTYVTVGSFHNYKAANDFKETLKEKGIEGAFLIAFLNGKKISMKEAREVGK